MFKCFTKRMGVLLLVALGVFVAVSVPPSSSRAQSRDAVLECDGGLLVWSQPSGSRFLIFFKGTGKFKSLDVEANFGRRVLFGIQGRSRNQIHADKKSGSVRCRYH
jgi:hypothetical protein